ncbi:60S ribosomal protein L6 [Porphyridium purpureum]|uniref:60S ribosomal protein L6 n=1 Tax=Porphyridium purpureum TaxID=35688 RepID=A0A5J4YX57_PORPP|nr:60S ribosomal protein L6 [Porphyridium purpureum]|eukprot:POR0415..scf209_3
MARAPRYYSADDVPTKKKSFKPKPAKIRASITPGTVLILLAGRFRGKRVVCLKVLPSGTLVITGPYAVNGVPLRRVNPRYVIASSTKVDISSVSVDKFDDAYFKKAAKKSAKSEKDFFQKDAEEKPKAELPAQFKQDQKEVDNALTAALKKDALLKCYMKARFSLTKGQAPHEMKF